MKAQELFSSQFLGGLSNKSEFRIKIRVGNFIISLSKYPDTWVWILGYWYYPTIQCLDTWIVGYFNYLGIRILGYMDTWIHGYPFTLDTWILGYFGYQFFSLSRFWISYPSIRIVLDTFLPMVEKCSQIQVLRVLPFSFWKIIKKEFLIFPFSFVYSLQLLL